MPTVPAEDVQSLALGLVDFAQRSIESGERRVWGVAGAAPVTVAHCGGFVVLPGIGAEQGTEVRQGMKVRSKRLSEIEEWVQIRSSRLGKEGDEVFVEVLDVTTREKNREFIDLILASGTDGFFFVFFF